VKKFKHVNASTVDEAVLALGGDKAKVIAGGTDLLSTMKNEIHSTYPEVIVNLKTIPGLSYIKEEDGTLKIGALTSLADVAENTGIQCKYTVLAQAARRTASPHVREMGTIGGNICQLNRCWYYRSPNNRFDCLRKNPAGLCYALTGDNRYHSIFGAASGCIAVNPGDIAPALMALDARIKTSKRTIGMEEFFIPGSAKMTVLDDDEIVTEIQIPEPDAGTRSAFIKFSLRKSIDFPVVNCASVITNGAGIVSEARICLNAVYYTPYRAIAAEEAIVGKSISESTAEDAGRAAVSGAKSMPKNKYKVQIAKTLVKRTILCCYFQG